LQKIHSNSELPKKRSKKHPLTKEDKKSNRTLASERVANENVIGMLKRFKIIADRYRNRRKRFSLRFNLIAGIYNWELKNYVMQEVYSKNYFFCCELAGKEASRLTSSHLGRVEQWRGCFWPRFHRPPRQTGHEHFAHPAFLIPSY
jgi:hypothetical protein